MDERFKQQARLMLIRHEGLRESPYKDTEGKLTIGIGHNLSDVPLSAKAIDQIFFDDLFNAWADCNYVFTKSTFDEFSFNQQLAMINMMFNLGLPRFYEFKKMLAAIRDGDWETAAREALDSKWAKQVGRRSEEVAQLMVN